MPNQDAVQQFNALRQALIRERDQIQRRLQQINQALGESTASAPSGAPGSAPAAPMQRFGPGRPAPGQLTIREAITKATANKAMNVREIVEAVQQMGYKFSSSNPINSVGAYLYAGGKKHFKNEGGRFSPLRGASAAPAAARTNERPLPQRLENKLTLREAITKATSGKELTIREIVDAVQKMGYKFASSNPVNSVGAYLYAAGKKHFKNQGGKFSPLKSGGAAKPKAAK